MKKKLVVFSGAGLDRESGVLTFRDCEDGYFNFF
jgi:NAD-dependent SIR2 family protein deacetylase